jgi:DNA topoisomerase-1
VGECAACAAAGRHGDLVAHKSEKTGKRFIRCTNYDDCGTSYPLPQRGELHATGETCPDCGAPIVEVITARGPWRICVNMDCPGKEKKAASGRGRYRGGKGKPAAKPKSASKAKTKAKAKTSAKPKPKPKGKTSAKPKA